MISNNVMKMDEWENSVWYKVGCSCGGGDDCDCQFEFEFDDEFGQISMNFYKRLNWADYYYADKWYERYWVRIKQVCKLLWTGETEVEGHFIVQSVEHMNAFIEALQEGKQKLEVYKDKNKL